ncbi:putative 2-alkenal reductase (NAD(P)(+)) [Arabidopsis thaliana]|uniref:Uncharacterized protein n=2 Tax=Arabidopsis TaxID=3701 RepID=A0A5S9Y9Y8_ARATH|nr:hypothetical protein ISN44_As05g031760 [Arabidopsis suecica]CAA0406024.1 unnamed protein product [Arabidopsis thaliana]
MGANRSIWNDLTVSSKRKGSQSRRELEGAHKLATIIYKRIEFKILQLSNSLTNTLKSLYFVLPYVREGKITYVEDIAQGLENGPFALIGLFHGKNVGNNLLKLLASEI